MDRVTAETCELSGAGCASARGRHRHTCGDAGGASARGFYVFICTSVVWSDMRTGLPCEPFNRCILFVSEKNYPSG